MIGRCGRSLSLILTVLTLWPTSVEGQGQQQGRIEPPKAIHLAVCQPADGQQHISTVALQTPAEQIDRTQPARHPLAADVTTVGRAEVRLAVGVITRYLAEQAVFWIRNLIASQPPVEE